MSGANLIYEEQCEYLKDLFASEYVHAESSPPCLPHLNQCVISKVKMLSGRKKYKISFLAVESVLDAPQKYVQQLHPFFALMFVYLVISKNVKLRNAYIPKRPSSCMTIVLREENEQFTSSFFIE